MILRMFTSIPDFKAVNRCIYCCSDCSGTIDDLDDEHVVPIGLGGDLVLPKASCKACGTITGRFEQNLLRGHYWPLRKYLGIRGRRPKDQEKQRFYGMRETGAETEKVDITEEYPGVVFLGFAPPSILQGSVSEGPPVATQVYFKHLSDAAYSQNTTAEGVLLPGQTKTTFPADLPDLEVDDVVRLLSKIALSYAVGRRGLDAFDEVYIREIICGQTDGANTYVGGASSPFIGPLLSGQAVAQGLHALMDYVRNQDVCVYIQLFRAPGDPPPIYEVVVGRLRTA